MNANKTLLRVTLFGGVCTFVFGLVSILSPSHLIPARYVVHTVISDVEFLHATVIDSTNQVATVDTPAQRVEEPLVSTSPLRTYLTCPLTPQAHRTRIDFTKGGTMDVASLSLVAHLDAERATRVFPLPSPIPAGTYAVYLASYDDRTHDTGTEYREEWFVTLFGGDGEQLYASPHSRDLKDTESQAMERVATDAFISESAYKAVVHHAAYPDSVPNSITPLCVALDLVAPLHAVVPHVATRDEQATSEEEEVKVQSYLTCPIPERAGRVIADYTKGGTVPLPTLTVIANGAEADATRDSVPVSLPHGVYDVRVASHRVGADHGDESWYTVLYGADGATVAHTPASRDIPGWDMTFVSRTVEAFPVERDVTHVAGMHAGYPSEDALPVAVLCVSFDRTGEVPPPTTSASVSVGTVGEAHGTYVAGDTAILAQDTMMRAVPYEAVAPIAYEAHPLVSEDVPLHSSATLGTSDTDEGALATPAPVHTSSTQTAFTLVCMALLLTALITVIGMGIWKSDTVSPVSATTRTHHSTV